MYQHLANYLYDIVEDVSFLLFIDFLQLMNTIVWNGLVEGISSHSIIDMLYQFVLKVVYGIWYIFARRNRIIK